MASSLLVFSTRSYADLAASMRVTGGFPAGELETHAFPDGEHYRRIVTPVDGRDVALVGGTVSDADTLELYDLACGLVEQGARSLVLVCPYFGCATMERSVLPGEVVTAKARARLLSSIPAARFGNRIVLVDLHSEGIPYYFEGALRAVHLYAKPVVADAARRLGGDDFVLACTDAGRAKWVESLANDLGVDASFVFKRRVSGDRTEITAMAARVEGRRVVIYDDMIRTGGSLVGAARAYRDAGASEVFAVSTHGVLPGDAASRLVATGLFGRIVVTDSHPRARACAGGLVEVAPLGPLLAGWLGTHAASAG